eukprot:1156038-Pelagomonas_calceolata.AAC.3
MGEAKRRNTDIRFPAARGAPYARHEHVGLMHRLKSACAPHALGQTHDAHQISMNIERRTPGTHKT